MKLFPRLMVLAAAMLLAVPLATVPAYAQGTVIATDNFNRADETPFAIGGNWGRVVAGNYDGFSTLTNNQVNSASNEGIYYWQGAGTFNNARQFARQRVVQKDGELGLVLLGGPDHAIMMQWGPPGVNTTLYIYWYANGSDQGVLHTTPSTINNGDIIEGVLDGGVIYAKVNGATVASVPNTTTLTSGKPGFITYFDPLLPTQVAIMDDWEAGTPPSFSISGTITEDAVGLSGVLVTASGGFIGNTTTNIDGEYTLTGVSPDATNIVLTPTLSGHTMSPLTRTVAGPVTANVTGEDFTSTLNSGFVLTVTASNGAVGEDPELEQHPSGSNVTLTPIPDAGHTFISWSGDVPVGDETDNPLQVTMDQDRTIHATFTSETAIAIDHFNRADETPLTVGGNWAQALGGNANLAGNQVAGNTGEALYYWTGSGTFNNARQYAKVRVVNSGGQAGVALLGGSGQAVVVSWNAGRVFIYWYSGGGYQGELANVASVIQAGDILEGILDNGTITAKVNGAVVTSVANSTSLTAGKPGFEMFQAGAILDDWEAGLPASFTISGTITENAAGLSGVLVTASGGFSGNTTTNIDGDYTLTGVSPNATNIVLTPTLAGHTMSPLTRTVAGPVTADVTGEDFTSTANSGFVLNVTATNGTVSKDPDQELYPSGTPVTLTPTPNVGFTFMSWSGDVPVGDETDNPLLVTMNQDRTIHATFMSQGATASDDFNRANETPLTVGGNWAQALGGNANLAGNQVAGNTGEALYYWTGAGTFNNARQYAKVRVVNSGGQAGVALLGGSGQAVVVSWNAGRVFIYWYSGGGYQGELANVASVIQAGDILEGVLDNGTITAKVNGAVVTSVANSTSLTAGKPGFEMFQAGAILDDWEAGLPASFSISGTITENATGLSGVLVTASGGFSGNTTTNIDGDYTINGVPPNATNIVLTPTLAGHTMSPLTRTVAGPVTADVTGEDFTSTANSGFVLNVTATNGTVSKNPDQAQYPSGTPVTLTPTPNLGYTFGGWSGDVPAGDETDNPLLVTMNQDRTIHATFVTPDVVAWDTFNRANETPLAVGGSWTQSFGGGSANLTTNRVAGNTGEALYYWTGSGTFSNTRQYSRVKVTQATGQVGLVLLGGSGQAIVVAWNAGTLFFYWYTGSTYQGNLTTVSSTLQNGDVVEALLENGVIYAKINNTVVGSVANSTTLTAGKPGFETFQAGAILDDWEAGPPVAVNIVANAGTGGSITPLGTVSVPFGTDQGFAITPAAGYATTNVVVDGNPVGAVASYNFTNVQVPHTITASFAPTELVAAAPVPASAITLVTPCVSVPVVFTRTITTPLRGYSVTLQLSSNLSLCGAQFASGGYALAPTNLLVTPLGGNRWTVDEATLGEPCGATGNGTLFTVHVTSADLNGTGTITVESVKARDCVNDTILAFAGTPATINIDREGPAQTSNLVATQVTTGNYIPPPDPSHSTTPVALSFTVPPGAVSVEVYRRPFGGYPQYDENGGAEPTTPSTLPAAGWTLTGVTGSGQTDEPATRDYWYYALVTRDALGNPSVVSNLTGGTLNYYLGDVSNGLAMCAGDDRVDTADLSLLGAHYGATIAVNGPAECIDFGPTSDHSLSGRPLTDNRINFEDFVILALGYGTFTGPQARMTPVASREGAPRVTSVDRLNLAAPSQVVAGSVFEARVQLRAGGALHALSVALEWNGSVVEPTSIRSGGLFENAGGVTFAAGRAALDGALLGAARGLEGEGDFAIVTFRAIADGDPQVRLAQAMGRDRDNRSVAFDQPAVEAPTAAAPSETRLLAAVPGPFRTRTTIGYTLAADSGVELVVFGIDGRRVRTLQRGAQTAGIHRITWDGTDESGRSVAAGVYYTRLVVGSQRFSQPLVKLAR